MSASCIVLVLLPLISAQSFHRGRCPTPAVQPNFNLQEYMGKWYEIEKLPAYFAKGKCIQANYSLKKDGTVQVLNSQVSKGKKTVVEGTAKILDSHEPGKLGVRFTSFTPYSPYWVLTTDYTNVSVVYSCMDVLRVFHMDFAWILSRSPSLPDETVNRTKELLMSEGINVSNMKPTKQDCHEGNENDGDHDRSDENEG
ncbi:apolipoprotein D-like [Anableps anableps]